MKTKNLCRLLLLSFTLFSAFIAGAKESYYSDYPVDGSENQLLLKFKLSGIVAKSKGSGLPAKSYATGNPVVSNPPYNLIANGYGGEGSATIFYNSYIASEISVGFNVYKLKKAVLDKIYIQYSNSGTPSNKSNLYSVPLTLTLQYHVAPYGGFSPYFGAGYGVSYFHARCKALNVKMISGGFVLQGGLDLLAQDNTLLTLDVKKYFMSNRAKYSAGFLGAANDTPFTLKINPLVISAGIGFKM